MSERYVPLYNTERESDTVKKVNISRYLNLTEEEKRSLNPLDLPLYVISLVEHKTKVEYNVAMQLLRYMVHIWEDYEREMNRLYPGISNTDLLAKGDEISLVMLINKIQTPEDMSAFMGLSGEQLDDILKDTREHLLDILSKVFRALPYNMNMPEHEEEGAAARIKERKMGRLFENVTMDIQAERRNTAKARAERDSMQQKLDSTQQKLNSTQQDLEIHKHIFRMILQHCPDDDIIASLTQRFNMTDKQAMEYIKQACDE